MGSGKLLGGKIKYTDTQIKNILSTITIIIDTREQVNSHITEYLDKNKINYITRKLNYGDYSFYIPKNEELGIMNDITFEDEIVVERKNSCDEFAGNLTKDRARIEKEFALCKADVWFMIEDEYHNMVKGNYRSNYPPKSLVGSLYSFSNKYNIRFNFINKEDAGKHIYCVFYYYLKNKLN